MISDQIDKLTAEQLPFSAKALDVSWEVSAIGMTRPPAEGVFLFAQFIFRFRSPLIGQFLWHTPAPLPLEAALDPEQLGRYLFGVVEELHQIRATAARLSS